MKIYLVRHAVFLNPKNVFPFHLPLYLSPVGRRHVHRAGEWFKSQSVSGLPVISSPIVRCVQTTEIIASHTKSDVTLDERLIEVTNPKLQGMPLPKDHWKTEETDPDTETHDDILKRMQRWMNDMIKTGGDVIGVSHGSPITILYFTLTGTPIPKHFWSPQNEPNNIQRGEIVVLNVENGEFRNAQRIKV